MLEEVLKGWAGRKKELMWETMAGLGFLVMILVEVAIELAIARAKEGRRGPWRVRSMVNIATRGLHDATSVLGCAVAEQQRHVVPGQFNQQHPTTPHAHYIRNAQ